MNRGSLPSGIFFGKIEYGTDAYRLECNLREEVLRRPLGLSLYDEDLAAEAGQAHFGLFRERELLACVIATALSPGEAKLRQMAVSPGEQGKGLGRVLISLLEMELLREGFCEATLHARATAIGFYERLGYERFGVEFVEVGIPHVNMRKTLNQQPPPELFDSFYLS